MKFQQLLKPELITFLSTQKKRNALEFLCSLIDKKCDLDNIKEISRAVLYREKLMSTGIGLGIAIPHARVNGIDNILVAVGVNKKGFTDYESVDGIPVKIIFMIILDKTKHREYIKIIARVVKKAKKQELVARILAAKEPKEVFEILTNGEQ